MKRTLICFFFIFSGVFVFAEKILTSDTFDFQGEWIVDSGEWTVADGKLLQLDKQETIATISRIVRQRGILMYSLDVRYLDGLEDGYGGFGIHIAVNEPTGLRSWGQNSSLLLWFTLDEEAYTSGKFYAQVYKSTSMIHMNFHDMRGDEFPLTEAFMSVDGFTATRESGESLRIMFSLDSGTGKGKLYSPTTQNAYQEIDLKTSVGEGMYIALRTNSISVAFDNVSITQLD